VRAAQDLPSLGCSETKSCSIVVQSVGLKGTGVGYVTVVTEIHFAPSYNDCPVVGTPDLVTAGEVSASRVIQAWAARRCTGTDPLAIGYTEQSSELGRSEFQAGQLDMGITSLPFSAAELAAEHVRPYTYAPLDATATVVAFSIPNGVAGGPQIQSVNLTPRLLARLITDTDPSSGSVSTNIFQDPEYLKLNPLPAGSSYPQFNSEGVLVRGDRNADATLVTGWIASNPAAQQFLAGTDQYCTTDRICVNPAWKNIQYPTDKFEVLSTVSDLAPVGEAGLLPSYAFYRLTNYGNATSPKPNSIADQGVFSIMDLASARAYHLGIATLCRTDDLSTCIGPDGPASPAPSPGSNAGLLAGYQAMTTNADGITQVPNFAATSPAYPWVKYDYAVVPTRDLSPTAVQKAKDFLTYAADPNGGQSTAALPSGYLPLSGPVAAETLAAANLIQSPTPPTTTTTTTTTTPTTIPIAAPLPPAPPAATTPAVTTPPATSVAGASPVALATRPVVILNQRPVSRRAPIGVFGAIADNPSRLTLPVLMVLGLLALVSGPIIQVRARQASRRSAKPA
jgi:hypothetical protein